MVNYTVSVVYISIGLLILYTLKATVIFLDNYSMCSFVTNAH